MSKVIVSTCGTSLLTNTPNSDLRQLLMKTANYQESDFNKEEKSIVDEHISSIENQFNDLSIIDVKKKSAELNGILTYYEDQIPSSSGTPDIHFILVSDTYQGRKVGEILANWLMNNQLMAQVIKIADLATNNRDNFRLAMSELINWCNDTLMGYRDTGYEIIFNLTGGFKSVQGFLQSVGMFYADKCVYIFQFSSQLLTIPRLPIKLDTEEIIGNNLTVFRKLDVGFTVKKSECNNIPETLLFYLENEDEVTLSEWGQLIWLQSKNSYYKDELLPPLSEKLVYSDEFKKNMVAFQHRPDRIIQVNQRCDQLSRFLESPDNDKYNPPSLDYKPITKSPFPDSDHECDAWNDQDAQRLFGHRLGNGRYQVDRIAKGLH
ncbi:putative CRISPR-associated protein [Cyanobacterium stanieri LEGE 03274]|uniref:CRISPR-associated protein n=1 Tax=Cyanobacterium stanieri LEGE 03274 TaxID=1828756 RepID=A0ABR9V401_9CHRO|nr:putative CRISPR-associated protein [Cyanobacterium stanieri]MBE9222626.1 putative CRISPR-associated protein [Cyanobacterium stanieri LEGE 03274]